MLRTSLHHTACGCPGTLGQPAANASAAASMAAAQVGDSLVSNYCSLFRMGSIKAERRLHVAYMIPHHHVTGGMKSLCNHIQLLRERGHHVVAVYRAPIPRQKFSGLQSSITTSADATGSTLIRAMPSWCGVEADEEVLLRPDQHLAEAYPNMESLDAVVCGMFQQARIYKYKSLSSDRWRLKDRDPL